MQENNVIKIGEMTLSVGSSNFSSSIDWLIKGLIPYQSLCILSAAHNSLKTFIALDLSCAISIGQNWNSRKSHKGKVLYVAAEGSSGISKRLKAWEIANQQSANNVFVLGRELELTNSSQMQNLVQIVEKTKTEDGLKIELIVIDTLSQCLIGDENSPKDMTAFVRACNKLRHETGVSVLIVHHSGKDASKGPRGHSSLPSNVETIFRVTRDKNKKNTVLLHNDKQKDAETADTQSLTFEEVDLGITCEEGYPITSLARVSESVREQASQKMAENKITSFLNSLKSKKSTRGELKKHLFEDVTNLTPQQRQTFKRDVDNLLEAGLVTMTKHAARAHDSDLIALNIH